MEVVAIVLLVVVLAALVYFSWEGRESRRTAQAQMDLQRAETAQRMDEQRKELATRLDSQRIEMNQRLDAMHSSVGRSLASTSETIGNIHKQLGQVQDTTQRVLDVGKDISALQDLLKPPKLRGGFGEMLLEQLLAQILPCEYWESQYHFRNGEAVDAVIKLPEGLVPIDSKFPMESFCRALEAPDEDERSKLQKAFARDVQKRVEEVAKYIRPDEGTLDFALMYIPAENVYYETLVAGDGLMSHALERRVHLVSPNTFYAFLQALVRGLHSLRVEKHAEEILGRLDQLQHEFDKFQGEFDVLGTHLGRAKNKYDELDKMAEKFENRLARPLEHRPSELPASVDEPALPEPAKLPLE